MTDSSTDFTEGTDGKGSASVTSVSSVDSSPKRARRSHLRAAGVQVRALLDQYQARARCGGRRARERFGRMCEGVCVEHQQEEFSPQSSQRAQRGGEAPKRGRNSALQGGKAEGRT